MAELDTLKRTKKQCEQDIDTLNEKRNGLTAERKRISAEEWNGDTVCPTCGQAIGAPLPPFLMKIANQWATYTP